MQKGVSVVNDLLNMDFNEPTGKEITRINGLPIPKDLLDFLHKHNGGEGRLGEWMLYLSSLEEMQKLNDEWKTAEYLGDAFIFGIFDIDILIGYNAKAKRYCYIHSGYVLPEGIYNVSAGFEDFLNFLARNDIHF